MDKKKKPQYPDPDDFTVAFREAMRHLRRAEIEEHIRKSPDVPMTKSPKVSTGQPNPEPMVDEGEVRRRADLIMADMEIEKQRKMGAFSKKIATAAKKHSSKAK